MWPWRCNSSHCVMCSLYVTDSLSSFPCENVTFDLSLFAFGYVTPFARVIGLSLLIGHITSRLSVLASLHSLGGDGTVYVLHKPTELGHSFLFCSCVCFCLCDPFNRISFHKFSRQLRFLTLFFRFYLCLILSYWSFPIYVYISIYIFMKVSFSTGIIHSGWLAS